MQSVTSATAVATTARANDITLYASLELSKSKWVVTIDRIRAARSFPSMWLRVETALACSSFFRGRWRRPSSATACRSKRSSFRKRDWTGSRFIDCCSPTGLRATSSTRLRSRSTGGIGGPRPMRSTAGRLRTLMAWARGERRVCSMVRAPSREDEDRRRLTRERGTLLKERISIPIESGPAQRPRRPGLRSASA